MKWKDFSDEIGNVACTCARQLGRVLMIHESFWQANDWCSQSAVDSQLLEHQDHSGSSTEEGLALSVSLLLFSLFLFFIAVRLISSLVQISIICTRS